MEPQWLVTWGNALPITVLVLAPDRFKARAAARSVMIAYSVPKVLYDFEPEIRLLERSMFGPCEVCGNK